MVEPYLRQSALAHLGLAGRAHEARGEAGVALAEVPFRAIADLRLRRGDGAARAAVESAFGLTLPEDAGATAGTGELTALWLGPDEWWVVEASSDPEAGPRLTARLRQALDGHLCALTDVSESRTCLRVSGPQARALLQKGCPLDLHPRAFLPGQCAQTLLAKATVVLHLAGGDADGDGPTFDIYVLRSFAEYLWRWLEDAAREYGMAVVAR